MKPEETSYWVAALGASTQYFDVDGIRTRALHAGEGETVLLLHGVGGHLENFVYNVVPLAARSRKHVYAIDLVGHGLNSRPERPYTFTSMMDHVVRFADAIGTDRFSVAGLSLGGLVAGWLALRYPERVDKVVLTTTFGLHLDGTSPAEADSAFQRVRESNLKAMKTPTLDTVRERLRPLTHNPSLISEEMVATRHRVYTIPGAESAMASFVQSFYEERWKHILTTNRLQQITAQTLVVWGEHNTPPVEYAERATKEIPNARLHVCPNSGHWPHVEAVDEYNEVVGHFLGN